MKNIYFTISGGDGSGKTSLVNELSDFLKAEGVYTFIEPGGSESSKLIREALLVDSKVDSIKILEKAISSDKLSEKAVQLLKEAVEHRINDNIGLFETYTFAASRCETNKDVVKKKLSKQHILGTRSISCSMAYQGGGRGVPFNEIKKANSGFDLVLPTFEIHLVAPTEVLNERINKRTGKFDRLDKESIHFHEKVNQSYLDYLKEEPYKVYFLDATRGLSEISKDAKNIILNEISN